MMPRVSVVMGVYNEEELLPDALDSLLGQDFTALEILVVDDGSRDRSREVVAAYGQRDPRVQLLPLPVNGGLTRALNHGLARARGEFIARLDADDLALPQRLSRQVDFLSRHPAVGLVGGGWELHQENGQRQVAPPEDDAGLRWHSLFANPFCHSAVLFRRQVAGVAVAYDPACRVAQDYALWVRLMGQCRVANLAGAPLVRRRVRAGGISGIRGEAQGETALTVANGQQCRLLPEAPPTLADSARLRAALFYPGTLDGALARDFRTLLRLFRRLSRAWDHQERRRVGDDLVKSLLTAISNDTLAIAWRSGLLRDLVQTMPMATLGQGWRRLMKNLPGAC